MADIWSKRKRSHVMSLIRSRGNKETELAFARLLRSAQITGWRRSVNLPGKPDFVFRREKLAVFLDGCFWHGCPRCYRRPRSNCEYWDAKVERNKRRDRYVNQQLRSQGWSVLRFWAHSLVSSSECVARLRRALTSTRLQP